MIVKSDLKQEESNGVKKSTNNSQGLEISFGSKSVIPPLNKDKKNLDSTASNHNNNNTTNSTLNKPLSNIKESQNNHPSNIQPPSSVNGTPSKVELKGSQSNIRLKEEDYASSIRPIKINPNNNTSPMKEEEL